MKNLVLGLAASLLFGACTTDSTLHVDNQSDFVITEIYLTDSGSSSWGPNLIAGDQLNPDETLRLDVSCGTYDAMLVDETNVTCEIDNLDLCANDADWVIRNDTCVAFREAAKARAQAAAQKTAQ